MDHQNIEPNQSAIYYCSDCAEFHDKDKLPKDCFVFTGQREDIAVCPNCPESELKDAHEYCIQTPWMKWRANIIKDELRLLKRREEELESELEELWDSA